MHAGIHPLAQCMLGCIHPQQTPQADIPMSRHPPWADTPRQTPTAQCMLGYTPLCPVHAGIQTPIPCWVRARIHNPEQCMPGCIPPAGTPMGRLPHGQRPPVQCMLGYTPPGRHPLGTQPPWADTSAQADIPRQVHTEIHTSPGRRPWADTPLPIATAADDTHPFGMHSRILLTYRSNKNTFFLRNQLALRIIPCTPKGKWVFALFL